MVLRASYEILRRNLVIIRRNLALLDGFMERHGEFFSWVRPRAGAIGFVKFHGPMTSEELGRRLAEEGDVLLWQWDNGGNTVVNWAVEKGNLEVLKVLTKLLHGITLISIVLMQRIFRIFMP